MKYYLETNALRALGSKLGENKALLSESYTSLFALFELAKGIGRKRDSEKRSKILSIIAGTELSLVDFMPFEVMRASFTEKIQVYESETVKEKLSHYLSSSQIDSPLFDELARDYEGDTSAFQQMVNSSCVKPKPAPKTIKLDLETMFAEPKIEIPKAIRELPENTHPSRVFMEMQKLKDVPAIYKSIFGEQKISDEEVLSMYNNQLDLHIFSQFAYTLKKDAYREAGAKNDFLDILHTVYLFDYDKIIVSDDKIFETLLPDINYMTIDDYKELI